MRAPASGSSPHGESDLPVTGTTGNLSFTFHDAFTANGVNGVRDMTVSGALSAGVITGTLTINARAVPAADSPDTTVLMLSVTGYGGPS